MKITTVEIRNFRSIENATKVFLEPNVTVLAGKNESGKSTFLLALKKFFDSNITVEDFHLKEEVKPGPNEPNVQVTFLLEESDLKRLFGSSIPANLTPEFSVRRWHSFSEDFFGPIYDYFTRDHEPKYDSARVSLVKCILEAKSILGITTELTDYDFEFIFDFQKGAQEAHVEIKKSLENKTDDEKANVTKLVNEIGLRIQSINIIAAKVKQVRERLLKLLPKAIYLDSFNDLIPDHIDIAEAKSNSSVMNFFRIANTDFNSLAQEANHQKRRRLTDNASTMISGSFSTYYQQESVRLTVSRDGDTLSFYVYDGDNLVPFTPVQRSRGFQWFLSFYIALNSSSSRDTILLIDEPGLYLHAKAQQDVLRIFNDLSKSRQVVYSTHSPYLIDPENLGSIRVVTRKNHATTIENQFYKGADRDTFTPIITAVGLDLTQGFLTSKHGNILIEGISDYYFLQALRLYFGTRCPLKKTVNLIPCVGASQVANLVCILMGWGIEFKVLFDNDKAGRDAGGGLQRKYHLDDGTVCYLADEPGKMIESLFSKEDYNEYVLMQSGGLDDQTAPALGKALLAKRFFTTIKNEARVINLSQETESNFVKVFERLK